MKVESLGSMATYYQQITPSQVDVNFEKVQSTTGIKDNVIENESSGDIYEELSGKYDIRNATLEELEDIAHSLYLAGEMSFTEASILTFDYERATQNIKKIMNGLVPISFNLYETAANEMGQRDWIAEFEAQATKDLRYGNLIGHSNKMKILNILQQLEK